METTIFFVVYCPKNVHFQNNGAGCIPLELKNVFGQHEALFEEEVCFMILEKHNPHEEGWTADIASWNFMLYFRREILDKNWSVKDKTFKETWLVYLLVQPLHGKLLF